MYLFVYVCVCVRVCICACPCIVWRCEVGVMSCRNLNDNDITMIAANSFTDLPQLQRLFVLYEFGTVSLCVCVCVYVCVFVCFECVSVCGAVALWG